jgi:uncharacterized membrane protein YccC
MTDERTVTTGDLARDATGDEDRALSRDDARAGTERLEPLLGADDTETFRARWHELQAAFVDDPQHVVERADELVAELMQRLAQMFAAERSSLEEQWSSGGEASTEDLRVALQRYRSFFERLLAT